MIQALIPTLTTLIERIFPDQEQQAKAKAEMMTIMAEAEAEKLRAVSDVVVSEAKGESWLQRNWRPMTMVSFLVLLGSYWFGLAPQYLIDNPDLVSHLFTLLEIGIGGYIVGRSVEKTAAKLSHRQIFDAIRKDKGYLTQEDVDKINNVLGK